MGSYCNYNSNLYPNRWDSNGTASLWQGAGAAPLPELSSIKKAFVPKNGTKAGIKHSAIPPGIAAQKDAAAQRAQAFSRRKAGTKRDIRPCCIGQVPSRPTRASGRFSLPLRGDPHRTPALRTCTILRLALRQLLGAFPFAEFLFNCPLLYQPNPHPQRPFTKFYIRMSQFFTSQSRFFIKINACSPEYSCQTGIKVIK